MIRTKISYIDVEYALGLQFPLQMQSKNSLLHFLHFLKRLEKFFFYYIIDYIINISKGIMKSTLQGSKTRSIHSSKNVHPELIKIQAILLETFKLIILVILAFSSYFNV